MADAAAHGLGQALNGRDDLPADQRAIASVLLAKAKALLGDGAAAVAILDKVNREVECGAVPERASRWCLAQADLISAELHGLKTG